MENNEVKECVGVDVREGTEKNVGFFFQLMIFLKIVLPYAYSETFEFTPEMMKEEGKYIDTFVLLYNSLNGLLTQVQQYLRSMIL